MQVHAIDVLRESFEASCKRVTRTLAGIIDEEFFWEPVAGCWTVHRRSEQRAKSADGSGEWVIDYELPEPRPAPVTTIAWRTVHIAAVNYLYYDYAFGPATVSFDLEIPGSAAAAVTWLRVSQGQLRAVLQDSADADLGEPRLTNWGDLWPAERIWRTLIDAQVHQWSRDQPVARPLSEPRLSPPATTESGRSVAAATSTGQGKTSGDFSDGCHPVQGLLNAPVELGGRARRSVPG